MTNAATKLSALPNGRDAVDALRGKVVQFRAAALPKAAFAAESAGDALSKLALSTSRTVAGALRKRAPAKVSAFAAFLPASAIARGALRFAGRHPAVLTLAGLGIAAIGYVAWHQQNASTDVADADDYGDLASEHEDA